MEINNCKYCGSAPLLLMSVETMPIYGISCNCEQGMVVEARSLSKAINCWNVFNEVRGNETEWHTL